MDAPFGIAGGLRTVPPMPAEVRPSAPDADKLLIGPLTDLQPLGAPSVAVAPATTPVSRGGTGDTSLTAYAVLCGGTTATGAVQSVAALGSAGQILTSNGAGALPTFQTPSAATLDITGLTATDPALTDELPEYDVSATANRKVTAERLLGLARLAPGGRLTLTSGGPTTGASAATTLYYTPSLHDCVWLWDGTRWKLYQFAEVSYVATGGGSLTASKPYDVFLYDNSGTLTLEMVVWTNATTRASAIAIQDGRYVKNSDKTRLYLGTIYSNGLSVLNDTSANRHVWNMYNRERRYLAKTDTGQWNYTTATYRQANANSANQVDFVLGLPANMFAQVTAMSTNASSVANSAGIGLDSTTTNSAITKGRNAGANVEQHQATYDGEVAVGYHYLAWLEYSAATGTTTWYGDASNSTAYTMGLNAFGDF